MIELVAAKNRGGSQSALYQTWKNMNMPSEDAPTKSSFSEFRAKVSKDFFKDLYEADLKRLDRHRKLFKGFAIYAVDGDELALPASEDILASGYRGSRLSTNKETHYPKMMTAQVLDVINGVIRDFDYSATAGEYTIGSKFAQKLEKNSITLYDRLYCTHAVARSHIESENYFIFRVPSKKEHIQKEVREFCHSKKRRSEIIFLHPPLSQKQSPPCLVRMIKQRNAVTKEDLVVMTNLPEEVFADCDLLHLYRRRWEIETSFRDLTSTCSMETWRSKSLNGVLQEIYALFWLINQVRCRAAGVSQGTTDWLSADYQKSNLKFLAGLVADLLSLLIRRRIKAFHEIFDHWARRTAERRRHLSRSYPREIKMHRSKYKSGSLIKRRGP